MRACACGERSTWPRAWFVAFTSSTYRPRPVRRRKSSSLCAPAVRRLAGSLLRPRLSQTKQPALAATAARTGSGKTVTEATPETMAKATPDTMAEATPETTPEATAKTASEAVAKATVKMMESLHDDDRRREAEEPRRTFPIGKEVEREVVGRVLVAIGVGRGGPPWPTKHFR